MGFNFEAIKPFLPAIGKFALGMLPANAAQVVGKVVDAARQGIAIAQPVLNTMGAIADLPDTGDQDISLAEARAAVAELDTPGTFEDALAKAKAELAGSPVGQQP